MRSYNRWLFHEHFELVLTISKLYQQMSPESLLVVLNHNFAKPLPPENLDRALNRPPWSRYDLDTLADDFCLLFARPPGEPS